MAVRQASERMSMALWWKIGTSRMACPVRRYSKYW